jgi:hypothetical protein
MMDAASGKSPTVVLVVEDEPLLRMLAVEAVEEAGFVAIEKHGWAKTRSCGARPLATDQDFGCFGLGSASAFRASVQQSLCREALPGGSNGRGTAFAGRFVLIRNRPAPSDSVLFCSDLPAKKPKMAAPVPPAIDAGFRLTRENPKKRFLCPKPR